MAGLAILMGDKPEAAAILCIFRPVQALDLLVLIPVTLQCFEVEPPILHFDGLLKSPD